MIMDSLESSSLVATRDIANNLFPIPSDFLKGISIFQKIHLVWRLHSYSTTPIDTGSAVISVAKAQFFNQFPIGLQPLYVAKNMIDLIDAHEELQKNYLELLQAVENIYPIRQKTNWLKEELFEEAEDSNDFILDVWLSPSIFSESHTKYNQWMQTAQKVIKCFILFLYSCYELSNRYIDTLEILNRNFIATSQAQIEIDARRDHYIACIQKYKKILREKLQDKTDLLNTIALKVGWQRDDVINSFSKSLDMAEHIFTIYLALSDEPEQIVKPLISGNAGPYHPLKEIPTPPTSPTKKMEEFSPKKK